jgi:hypothetical protein
MLLPGAAAAVPAFPRALIMVFTNPAAILATETFHQEFPLGRQLQSISRFPVLREWHGSANSVMPVRHDVHRTCRTTFFAD